MFPFDPPWKHQKPKVREFTICAEEITLNRNAACVLSLNIDFSCQISKIEYTNLKMSYFAHRCDYFGTQRKETIQVKKVGENIELYETLLRKLVNCKSCASYRKDSEETFKLCDRFKPCELRDLSMSARENKPRCVFVLPVQFILCFCFLV